MQTWWTGSKTLSHRGGASWELQLCYQLGVPLLQGGQVLEVPLQLLVARFQRVDVVVELLDDVTDGVVGQVQVHVLRLQLLQLRLLVVLEQSHRR